MPEDTSKDSRTSPEVEDKYKLTFNQIDKRFVNLELAFGELSEKVKTAIDQQTTKELEQRVGDVEDLAMVENAGVIELKNMLEDLQTSLEKPKEAKFPTSPEDVNKFASILMPSLESSILPKINSKFSEIEEKIKNVPTNASIDDIKNVIDTITVEMKNLVDYTRKESEVLKNGAQSIDKMKSNLENLLDKTEKEVGDLKNQVQSINLKFSGIEENVKKIPSDAYISSLVSFELKSLLDGIKGDIEGLKDGIEAIDIKTTKRISDFNLDLENDVKYLKDKIETETVAKSDVDLKLSEIEQRVRSIYGVTDVNEVKNSIESVKTELRNLVDETKRDIEGLKNEAQSIDNKAVKKLATDFDSRFYATQEEINSLSDKMRSLADEVENDFGDLKVKTSIESGAIKKIVSEVSDVRTEFGKEIRYLKDKIEGEEATKADMDLKFLSNRVNVLKDNLDFLVNRKTELEMKVQDLEKILSQLILKVDEAAPIDALRKFEDDRKKLEAIDSKIDFIEKSIKAFYEGLNRSEHILKGAESSQRLPLGGNRGSGEEEVSTLLDRQINELLEKLISLETRIGTLERTLTTNKRHHPIILE